MFMYLIKANGMIEVHRGHINIFSNLAYFYFVSTAKYILGVQISCFFGEFKVTEFV